jgi:NAD(P)-dependent dehydrogenase (short-subunit alcohol dehydrogenase family)
MSDTVVTRLKADLTGKVAVITGAGSGLGLALALHAADRGMKVALADADPTLLAAAYEVVQSKGGATLAERIGQFDRADVQELAWRIEAELGDPWLVCNTAAGSTIESNLWGVINGVQVFAPGMVTRRTGHIVNIAAEDLFGIRGAAVDIAVSHAIVGLSESLYRELDSIGSPVGVTVVCPTPINTSLTSTFHSMPAPEAALPLVPPEKLAERIFTAVERHEFWVSSHAPRNRTSGRVCQVRF